jgi:hypothetical protein
MTDKPADDAELVIVETLPAARHPDRLESKTSARAGAAW